MNAIRYLHLGASRGQLALPQLASLQGAEWLHLGEPDWEDEVRCSPSPASTRGVAGYQPFYYRRGDRLPLHDAQIQFAFTEHFLEHLFLDEAADLLRECFRVLCSSACLRIAVPDADLRTYLPPEPVGFTTGDSRWFHPDKHKTRWSVYSLSWVLEQTGFRVWPLVYCDKFGGYHVRAPHPALPFYRGCTDCPWVFDMSYVVRFHQSLVVDAVK